MSEDKKLKKMYKKDIYGKTRKNIIDLAFKAKGGIEPLESKLNPMTPVSQPFPMPPQPMVPPEMLMPQGGPPMPPMPPGGMPPEMAQGMQGIPPMGPPPEMPSMMPPQAPGPEYDPMLMMQLLKSLGSKNESTIPGPATKPMG